MIIRALYSAATTPPIQDNCPHGNFLPISGSRLGACAKHQLQVRKSLPGENSDAPLLLRGFAKFRLFAMFPVLLTILLMWALCAILTQVLMAMVEQTMLLTIVRVVEDLPEPHNKDKNSIKDNDKDKVLTMPMTFAKVVEDLPVTIRTDGAKLDLLENTDWFRLPYPCQSHSPSNPYALSPIYSNHLCTKVATRIMCTKRLKDILGSLVRCNNEHKRKKVSMSKVDNQC